MMEHFCTSLRTVLWIGLIVRLKGIDGTDPGEVHVRFTAPSAVPLGHNGHFLCQTLASEAKPAWRLLFPSELSVHILPFYPKCVGVCVHDPSMGIINYTYDESTSSSTLIIQGTELNNGTLVTCVEYLAFGIEREKKEFLVYGPPPPPSAVSIVHHDLETINISWTAVHSAFNVTTSYNVYTQIHGGILNMVGFKISDPYLLYSPAPICGTMNFRIYSSNPAGLSSQYIQKGFSSLIISNLKEVSDSIRYSVSKRDNSTELSIFLEPPRFCPDYSGTKVNILLTSFTPMPSSQEQALDLSALPAKVELKDNAVYRYALFVRDYLTIYESDQSIYTTDIIPPVSIFVDVENQIMEIECKFHESSKARGCVVYIAEGNNPYFIGRKGNIALSRVGLPKGEITGVNITVLDWKVDGTEGTLAIPIQIVQKNLSVTTTVSAHRSVATIGLSSTSRRTLLAGAVLGAIALIVIVAVISAICIAFIYYHVKPHRHKRRDVQGMPNRAKSSDTFCTPSCMSLPPSPSPSPATMYAMIPGASLPGINYAPTASSTHSIASHMPPSPIIYPSLSASLARDASPPTPASTSALHVHFSLNPNRVDSPFATYDVPSHSPPIPVFQYQDPKSYAQQTSYALYDQLPRSANASPLFPALQVPTPPPPPNLSSMPPIPPPPPLPYLGRLSPTPEPVIRAPSPEYVAMSHPDEQGFTISSSPMCSKSPDLEDFSSVVPFTSSNFQTDMLKGHAPSTTFFF